MSDLQDSGSEVGSRGRPSTPRLVAAAAVVLLAAVLVYAIAVPRVRQALFVDRWSSTFSTLRTYDEAKRFVRGDDSVLFVKFASGEWVVAVNESGCSSGAGFDAMVIHDSNGDTYSNTSHHFCG